MAEPPKYPLNSGSDIKAFRELIGWSQAKLAEQAGTSQQTVDRIERGETKHSRALTAIQGVLQARKESASERKGKLLELKARRPGFEHSPVPTLEHTFPVFGMKDQGWIKFIYFSQLSTAVVDRPGAYALVVSTDQMAPTFVRGDVLFIDISDQPDAGSYVFAVKNKRVAGFASEDSWLIGIGEVGTLVHADATEAVVSVVRTGESITLSRKDWSIQAVVSRYSVLFPLGDPNL